MCLEYFAGKDLEMLLRNICYVNEEDTRQIFQQIMSQVHIVQHRHIAHPDIKLENILIVRAGNIKLCDFRMAILPKEEQLLKNVCGSLDYMTPEILSGKTYVGLAVNL